MYGSSNRAHDDEVVKRLGLVPLVRDLAAEDGTVAFVEHREALKRGRVLRDERAALDDRDVRVEAVLPRETRRILEDLGLRAPHERVRRRTRRAGDALFAEAFLAEAVLPAR